MIENEVGEEVRYWPLAHHTKKTSAGFLVAEVLRQRRSMAAMALLGFGSSSESEQVVAAERWLERHNGGQQARICMLVAATRKEGRDREMDLGGSME